MIIRLLKSVLAIGSYPRKKSIKFTSLFFCCFSFFFLLNGTLIEPGLYMQKLYLKDNSGSLQPIPEE